MKDTFQRRHGPETHQALFTIPQDVQQGVTEPMPALKNHNIFIHTYTSYVQTGQSGICSPSTTEMFYTHFKYAFKNYKQK